MSHQASRRQTAARPPQPWLAWWQDVCAGCDAGAAPGVAAWVHLRGQTLLDVVHGHATLHPAPVALTADHRFDLASLTKPLSTVACVLALAEDGRLDLDAPLATHGYTPRQLLTHQAGLPACAPLWRECASRDEVCAAVATLAPVAPPGSEVVYSDLGYLRLGFLVEELGGRRQDVYLRERLGVGELGYGPVPPETAVATESCGWRERVMRGEVHDENASRCDGVAGHAGLFGTARSVGAYLLALRAGRLLRPATLAEVFAPRDDVASERFWLGWKRLDYDSGDPTAFGHDGFTGVLAWCAPRLDLTLVLLTNRVHPTRDNRRIYDLRPDWVARAAQLAAEQT